MRKPIALALAFAASFNFGGVVWAEPVTVQAATARMVTATNPASIVKVLQDSGYRAELASDSTGDPMIRSASSGSNFTILFYGCAEGKDCATIQFFAGFSEPENGSITALNAWNAQNRFGRAYRAEDGAARLEMDLDLDDGGMSTALFEDNIEFWVTIMASFERHIRGD